MDTTLINLLTLSNNIITVTENKQKPLTDEEYLYKSRLLQFTSNVLRKYNESIEKTDED